ncbi:hypothetical protein Cgig2_033236 [Carnegiea gigantea]|uniref:Pentatricopeptide repeat-containing protein n=1 Tax=Carnegiea gigantea TaxID=171969 RepID=A0A9Q1GUP0_9CARY|nr:hypothetical protein Cgig2_033236 [Carnegiea gigantea]
MDVQTDRLVHHVACKLVWHLDPFVSSALMDTYAKCSETHDARKLFDRMPERDLVTWTAMIGAHGEAGDENKSLVLFDRMKAQGIIPDKIGLMNVVNACARVAAMYKARPIHDFVCHMTFSLDVTLGIAMIDIGAESLNVHLPSSSQASDTLLSPTLFSVPKSGRSLAEASLEPDIRERFEEVVLGKLRERFSPN